MQTNTIVHCPHEPACESHSLILDTVEDLNYCYTEIWSFQHNPLLVAYMTLTTLR